jgi:hypothetical protein
MDGWMDRVNRPRSNLTMPVKFPHFPVPAADKCGLIIGKRGDAIRKLQLESHCIIELDRRELTQILPQ